MGQARQLAFGIAGGLIGGLFTAGSFSAVGFSLGSALGAPRPKSKVGDLKVQVAETGTVLPDLCGGDIEDPFHPGAILEGGVKMAGVVIDCGPNGGIEGHVPGSAHGGGTLGRMFGGANDGGDRFLDCAIGFCRSDDDNPYYCKKLWADNKVILDRKARRGQDGYVVLTPIYATIDGQQRLIAEISDRFALYYGTSFQDPDPKVNLWHEGHQAPAYTNTCYVRISHFDLKPYGHIPTFYGLWENGVVKRSEQCAFFLKRGGVDASHIDTSAIPGQSRGWVKTQLGGARDIAELVAARSFCRLVEIDGKIRAVDLSNPQSWKLDYGELRSHIVSRSSVSGMASGQGGGAQIAWPAALGGQITEELDLPSMRHVRFSDVLQGYDENTVTARFDGAHHENVTTLDMPTVDDNASMYAWNRAALAGDWMMKDGRDVFLPPGRIEISPGDEVLVPRGPLPNDAVERYLVESLSGDTPGPVALKVRPFDPEVFKNLVFPPPQERNLPVPVRDYPYLFASDTAPLCEFSPDSAIPISRPGLWLAHTTPADYRWEGGDLSPFASNGSSFKRIDALSGLVTGQRASIGELIYDYSPVGHAGFSPSATLDLRMFWGAPVGAAPSDVRAGANIAVFESGLYLQWCDVAAHGKVGADAFEEFTLSNLYDGFAGSDFPEAAPNGIIRAGTRVLLLTDETGETVEGATWCPVSWKNIGKFDRVQGQPPHQSGDDLRSVRPLFGGSFQARNLQPLAPTALRLTRDGSGALTVSGRARTRWARDDAWTAPVGGRETEPQFSGGFRFRIWITLGATYREFVRDTPSNDGEVHITLTAAELQSAFGEVPTSAVSASVAQMGALGWGRMSSCELSS